MTVSIDAGVFTTFFKFAKPISETLSYFKRLTWSRVNKG